jgi:hypothetical protein
VTGIDGVREVHGGSKGKAMEGVRSYPGFGYPYKPAQLAVRWAIPNGKRDADMSGVVVATIHPLCPSPRCVKRVRYSGAGRQFAALFDISNLTRADVQLDVPGPPLTSCPF